MALRHAPPCPLALSQRMSSPDESPADGEYPPVTGAIVRNVWVKRNGHFLIRLSVRQRCQQYGWPARWARAIAFQCHPGQSSGSDIVNLVPLSGALSIVNSPPSMLMRSFIPTNPNEFNFLRSVMPTPLSLICR